MTTPATTPATRRRENTRSRLLDAAAHVFAEVGLDAASVEAVCERAGFTRGAFYSNFSSKDELFFALSVQIGAERLAVLSARVEELVASGELAAAIDDRAFIQQILDIGGDDWFDVALSSEIRIRALRDPELAAAYLRQEEGLIAGIAQIIRAVVESGLLTLRMEPEVAANLLMIVWEGTAVRGVMAGEDTATLRLRASTELGRLMALLVTTD